MSKKSKNNFTKSDDQPISDEPNTESTESTPNAEAAACCEAGRRSFVKTTLAAGIGAVAAAAPICGGVRMALAPATQAGAEGKFYPLAKLGDLTELPQLFTIVDDYKDAWTTTPNQKIGTLYLMKRGEGVLALHSLCPHAGCMILAGKKKAPNKDVEEEMLYCPCHVAHFALDGKRLDNVSPRDLDSLETKIEDGIVFVRYENFMSGIAEKKPMS